MPVTKRQRSKPATGTRRTKAPSRAAPAKTREAWLLEVANGMASWFDDLGFPLPEFQISSGFPSAGRRGTATAEAWQEDDKGSYRILVRPDRQDAYKLTGAIAHQFAHMAAGVRPAPGRHLFRHIAISIGLRGRATEAAPGRLFRELVEPIIAKAGPLPEPFVGPPKDARKAKQKTRLIKVSCRQCGYVARVSRKWLDALGEPHCPKHGRMKSED